MMDQVEPNDKAPGPTPPDWLQELNRAILESALDCIITMDAGGIVREFNPAAERVFGYSRAEAVGQELAELIVPPLLRERHRQGLAHYLRTGEGPVLGRRVEIAAIRADGTEILVELAITPLQIAGQPIFTAYLRDITERVRTERRRTAQYGVASVLAGSWSLPEAGPQIIQTIAASGEWVFGAIWIVDDSGGEMRCAVTWRGEQDGLEEFEEATRTTALPAASGLPGRVLASRQPTWIRDVNEDVNFLRKEAAAAAQLRGGFAFPLCAEGEVYGVLELFSPTIASPDADLLQLVEALGSQIGLFIRRRKIERELEAQKEAAEAANAAKDRFLATLSHELRTPLTPVLMWAESMVGRADLPEEVAEGLQMITRNVQLEARLIDDLLDLTRIARGKLQLRLGQVDAHELLARAIAIVQGSIDERHQIVQTRLEATHHRIHADAARMQQVFWNILGNAAKFTPEGGSVAVQTHNPAPDRLLIEFTDRGIGIDPKSIGKIFDAFEQIDVHREGLGLGLAISKAIVERHGGAIYARSAGVGHGSTFTVELPIA